MLLVRVLYHGDREETRIFLVPPAHSSSVHSLGGRVTYTLCPSLLHLLFLLFGILLIYTHDAAPGELLLVFQVDSNLCEALLTTGEPDLAYHPKLFISMYCCYCIFMCLVHVC